MESEVYVSKKTYTAKEVSTILGISEREVYNLCNRNLFMVLRLGKRCIRINKESFDKWFNSAGCEN